MLVAGVRLRTDRQKYHASISIHLQTFLLTKKKFRKLTQMSVNVLNVSNVGQCFKRVMNLPWPHVMCWFVWNCSLGSSCVFSSFDHYCCLRSCYPVSHRFCQHLFVAHLFACCIPSPYPCQFCHIWESGSSSCKLSRVRRVMLHILDMQRVYERCST